MTVPELNKAIAEALGELSQIPKWASPATIGDVEHYYDKQRVLHACHLDYCNNWNDLMPLVVEHRIDLTFPEEINYFIAEKFIYGKTPCEVKFPVCTTSPRRALAECLLKVLEAK